MNHKLRLYPVQASQSMQMDGIFHCKDSKLQSEPKWVRVEVSNWVQSSIGFAHMLQFLQERLQCFFVGYHVSQRCWYLQINRHNEALLLNEALDNTYPIWSRESKVKDWNQNSTKLLRSNSDSKKWLFATIDGAYLQFSPKVIGCFGLPGQETLRTIILGHLL